MSRQNYERLVTWRYLTSQRAKFPLGLKIGLPMVGSGLVMLMIYSYTTSLKMGFHPGSQIFQGIMIALLCLGALSVIFGLSRIFFSVFASFSILGLFIGVTVLVLVLAVISGFRKDLTGKILGMRAHIQISKERFSDHKSAAGIVNRHSKVAAVTPYLKHEGMISSPLQIDGVLIFGIDPDTVNKVIDLNRHISWIMDKPWQLKRQGALHFLKDSKAFDTFLDKRYGLSASWKDIQIKNTARRPQDSTKRGDVAHPVIVPAGKSEDNTNTAIHHKAPDEPTDKSSLSVKTEIRPPAETQRPRRPGVLIGDQLAEILKVELGSEVHLISPQGDLGPAGPIPRIKPFRVCGIFHSGMYEFDARYVYTNLKDARRLFGLENEITGLAVKTKDLFNSKSIGQDVAARLGAGFSVKDWSHLNRSLFSALKLEKLVMFIVLAMIILVASFNIISTLIMTVLEKGREIAIMKAMGAVNSSIVKIFLFQGVIIGTIGACLGLFFGIVGSLILQKIGFPLPAEVYYITKLPISLEIFDCVAIGFAAVGISALATIYPSWRAAGLRPVEGLRYE